MKEDMKKIALTDDQAEGIVGGNIQFIWRGEDIYCWGSHNPDQRYGFADFTALKNFVIENYDLYGEAGTLRAAAEAGIIWPL